MPMSINEWRASVIQTWRQQRGADDRRGHERRLFEHGAATKGRIASEGAAVGSPLTAYGRQQIEGEWFSREVNDLFWTPEASAFFDAKTAGFD